MVNILVQNVLLHRYLRLIIEYKNRTVDAVLFCKVSVPTDVLTGLVLKCSVCNKHPAYAVTQSMEYCGLYTSWKRLVIVYIPRRNRCGVEGNSTFKL